MRLDHVTNPALPPDTPSLLGVRTRAGTPLHYRIDGDPGAPLVACTHGVSLNRHALAPQVPALLAAGYRVLTWDVRGHGESQPSGVGITLASTAADLLALLDAAEAPEAALIGQSFGGFVSQEVFAQAPGRVRALVMLGTPALGDAPGPVMRRLHRLRIPLLYGWPDGHLRRTFAALVTDDPALRAFMLQAGRAVTKPDLIATSRAAISALVDAAGTPTGETPVLLVRGEHEETLVSRSTAAWARRCPGTEEVVIPGVGHLVNLEAPEACNAALLAFLTRVLPVDPADRPMRA